MRVSVKTCAVISVMLAMQLHAGELLFGAAQADITPDRPVALTGGWTAPITDKVFTPISANVLVVESRMNGNTEDYAIIVSCDVCVIRAGIQARFREHVAKLLPEINSEKIFLGATHTHKGPCIEQEKYGSYTGAMEPQEYVPIMFERMGNAVVKAWNSRKPGAVTWGMGHAVIAQNRRAVYANGSAQMYGGTGVENFRGLEDYEDHAVDTIFFLDENKKPMAIMVVVPCPAQSDERGECGKRISADYWHDVRTALRKEYGEDLVVLGFVAPAGDQSPHLMIRKRAETRMQKLRGVTRTQEMGRRIATAVLDVWDVVKSEAQTDLPFVHHVEKFDLPEYKVSLAEYDEAKTQYDKLAAKVKLTGRDYALKNFHGRVVRRYEAQQKAPTFSAIEMHVLRIGNVVIATNPFELYTNYGIQIQGRSPAEQTILIQLASPVGNAFYLATPRALAGKGYSAIPQSCVVGLEGGQMLVDRTVESIKKIME